MSSPCQPAIDVLLIYKCGPLRHHMKIDTCGHVHENGHRGTFYVNFSFSDIKYDHKQKFNFSPAKEEISALSFNCA